MAVKNRTQFKEYCLRKLGFPVINIEVDEQQVDDRVDDALAYMYDYNHNMIEKKYLAVKITQTDLDNNYITTPEELLAVTRILPIRGGLNASGSVNFLFDMEYQLTANAVLNSVGTGDVSMFYITKQYISTITDIFSAKPGHEFRRFTDKVHFIFDATTKLGVGDYVVLECHTPIDSTSRFWEDRLLKEYSTALIKRQWASNLSKFQKVLLPGGVELNASELYNQAQMEIDKLEQEVIAYSEPCPMFIG